VGRDGGDLRHPDRRPRTAPPVQRGLTPGVRPRGREASW
jgi:hypothetical protein